MKAVIQGGLWGGLILFVWGAVSWMALPYHQKTLHSFSNETLVETALLASLDHDQGGVYILKKSPAVFAVISPKGWGSMGKHMLIGLLTQIVAAGLVTSLLLKTGGMGYWGRVGFVLVFALTAGVVCRIPEWNWWGFSVNFILAEFADLAAGWFLAGLAIAKVTK